MPKHLKKITNALLNNLFNKAFLRIQIALFGATFFLVLFGKVHAQSKNFLGNNLTVSLNSQSISKLKFNDSTSDSKYNFSNTKFLIGYKHSLYSSFTKKEGVLKYSQINVKCYTSFCY